MCTVLLPAGVNPTAVDKYITITYPYLSVYRLCMYVLLLLPNDTAVKYFCTDLERCEILTGYLSLGC